MPKDVMFDKDTGISVHNVDETPECREVKVTLPKWFWEIVDLRSQAFFDNDLSATFSDLLYHGVKSFLDKNSKVMDKPKDQDWN